MEFKEIIMYKNTKFEKKLGVSFSKENWSKLVSDGILDEDKSSDANDWQTTFTPEQWGSKYHKFMYSKSLNKLRHTNFEEFYGNGIID